MAAGDISDALVTELGYKLRDTTPNEFSSALRFEALNYAQIRAAQMLDVAYLNELTAIKSSASIATGSVSFSTIDSGGIINGAAGIVACKVTPSGGSALWAHPTDFNKLRLEQDIDIYDASDSIIKYYVWASAVYFLLTTYTGSTADIYYLEYPAEMTTDVDPTLNVALHPIILDFAEAYCLFTDEMTAVKGKESEDRALLQIKILNEKVVR